MSPTPPEKREAKQDGGFDNMVDKAWNLLKSMKFAIVILLILAAASIFNLFANEFIVPVRGGASQAYATYDQAYGGLRAGILTFMQMYSPYTSWWYTVLLGLLLLSLLVCVIDRGPIVWRLVTKPRYLHGADDFKDVPQHDSVKGAGAAAAMEKIFKRRGFILFKSTNEAGEQLVAGSRNVWAHTGPWLVHVGFILLVLGGAMIARGSYQSNAGGLPGELLKPDESEWGFNIRVDDFEIIYHPVQVGQYVQVDDGAMIGRIFDQNDDGTFDIEVFSPSARTISSVDPARVGNRIDRRMQGGRLDQTNIADYVATLTIIENGQEVRTDKVEVNHPLRHNGYRFYQSSFNDRVTDDQGRWMTILNVRKDKGAPFVWIGIIICSVGLLVGMYFEPQRMYALVRGEGKDQEVFVAGRSERNRALFADRFETIVSAIREASARGTKEAS